MTPLSIYDDPPADAAEAAWYVYAVIDAASAKTVASLTGGQLPGIDRVPVRIVVAGGLAAVAAPVELARFRAAQTELSARGAVDLSDDGWLAGALRTHDRVVEQVFSRVPVLPARFGAFFPDRGSVIDLLTARSAQLRRAYARVAGSAQWSVAVAAESPAVSSTPAAEDGTSWMLRRRDAMLARQAARDRWARAGAGIHRELSAHAEEVSRSRGGAEPAARGFYLVRRDHEEKFAGAVRELRDRAAGNGLRLAVEGPRPPYHFAGGELGDG
jgi:hypothetical protein